MGTPCMTLLNQHMATTFKNVHSFIASELKKMNKITVALKLDI
jgi:hypothetical protein